MKKKVYLSGPVFADRVAIKNISQESRNTSQIWEGLFNSKGDRE